MFGTNYCDICGMKVGKGNDFERFGMHFCSEEHVQQYTQQVQKARQEQLAEAQQTKKGGC